MQVNVILLAVLVLLCAAIATAAVVVLASAENARRVACRLIGWAMFIEKFYAEYDRCRAIGNDERDRRLAEFGIEA